MRRGSAEIHRKDKVKKENHFKSLSNYKKINATNKERYLKEVYKNVGSELTLVISV